MFKVGDMEVQYKRLSNNIRETIQIFGPTTEDLFVAVSPTDVWFCFTLVEVSVAFVNRPYA